MKNIKSLFSNPSQANYEFNRLRTKYPDRIPVIIESELLTKNKFLVPLDLHVSQLQFVVRKKLKKVYENESIFLFFRKGKKSLLKPSHQTIENIFNECVPNLDGFLYVDLQKENTFG